MPGYFLGIDQGSSLTTAVIVDENLHIAAKCSRPHRQYYPKPGWVEHDPMEIYENCLAVAAGALAQIPGAKSSDLRFMGLDHQGETCLFWDKKTGLPVYNAIVWQDRRTSALAESLKKSHGPWIREITGMLPDAYHSATKLRWILDHVPGVRKRAEKGELLAGTLNTWLFWKFSGGAVYATEACSGSRLMLMDIRATEWSREIIDLLGLPQDLLAPIYDCNHVFGYTDPGAFLGIRIPIAGSTTDSPAGLIGGGCTEAGMMKTSYGTGSFMNLLTGEDVIITDSGLFSSCLWRLSGKKYYTTFAACYVSAGAVQWLKDGLRIVDQVSDTEAMAESVPDSNDVYFVPAFAGLATPFWDQFARGLFIGLTSGVTREHLVRSVLEGIAYQVANCFQVMKAVYQGPVKSMRADGGMIENGFLMQFQADMLGIPIEVPEEKETAAFGAACLAAYTMGVLPSLSAVNPHIRIKRIYEPSISEDERLTRLNRWLEAAERSRAWVKPESI